MRLFVDFRILSEIQSFKQITTIAHSKRLLSELDDTAIESYASEIKGDRRNHEYSLNSQGLILYTLGITSRVRNVEMLILYYYERPCISWQSDYMVKTYVLKVRILLHIA